MAPLQGVVRALSTALPRDEIIYGKLVHTSIVRDPVAGPVYFGEGGPENSRTAVHIEHVLAFGSQHYDYWARELGVPRDAWPWAFWGENITLDVLDEATLCIGDIVRLGPVVLEVTGPRTPCFKLSWRLGQGQDFLKRLVASGRVGVYLRVKEPGYLSVGDPVSIEPAGKTTITVAQVARMIGELPVAELPTARELVKVRELGTTTRTMIGYKINFLDDAIRCRAHRWPGWRRFRIAGLQREGRDATSVMLVAEDGKPIAPYRAGQHVTAKLPGTPPIIRSWSISEFEAYPNRYRITVRCGEGAGSHWINDAAQVGDIVQLRAPSGRFVLDRSSFCRVVFVSAGVGITPLLSMLRAHVLREDAAAAVHWLHSGSDSSTALHAAEVDDLLGQFRLSTRQVHFTRPSVTDDPASFERTGRITREHLEEILLSTFSAADSDVIEPGEYSQFYVCGPADFNADMVASLLDLGVEPDKIFTEKFGAVASARPGRTAPASVRLERSGVTIEWDPEEGLTLLELLESAGIDAPFSCRAGNCGTCETALIAGQVDYGPVPEVPLGPGRCLTCCARPASETLTLDL